MIYIVLIAIVLVAFYLVRPRYMSAEEEMECDMVKRRYDIALYNFKSGTMPKEEFESIRQHLLTELEGIKEKYD